MNSETSATRGLPFNQRSPASTSSSVSLAGSRAAAATSCAARRRLLAGLLALSVLGGAVAAAGSPTPPTDLSAAAGLPEPPAESSAPASGDPAAGPSIRTVQRDSAGILAHEHRHYICYRAEGPIALDGRLDDAAWAAADWTEPFIDIRGASHPAPPLATRAKLLWDDEHLYIGAWMDEPHVYAYITAHDARIFSENDFEVFIDPNGDNHEYYELEINAANTTWDLLMVRPYKDGAGAASGWEIAGMRTAVWVDGTINDPSDTDRGWSVEIALPWTALRDRARTASPPLDGHQWRVNFSRVERHTEVADGRYRNIEGRPAENWVWSPQHVINMHRPETWGVVQFSERFVAAASGTEEPRDGATFVRDPAAPVKALLHRVYYAQRAFRLENERWAVDLDELVAWVERRRDELLAAARPWYEERRPGTRPPGRAPGGNGGPLLHELDAAALDEAPLIAAGLLVAPLTIETTATLFEIIADVRAGDATERWHMFSDGRIWRSTAQEAP